MRANSRRKCKKFPLKYTWIAVFDMRRKSEKCILFLNLVKMLSYVCNKRYTIRNLRVTQTISQTANPLYQCRIWVDMFVRNVGWNSTDYTASYPRKWYSFFTSNMPVVGSTFQLSWTGNLIGLNDQEVQYLSFRVKSFTRGMKIIYSEFNQNFLAERRIDITSQTQSLHSVLNY
jgi:hypothetical protein